MRSPTALLLALVTWAGCTPADEDQVAGGRSSTDTRGADSGTTTDPLEPDVVFVQGAPSDQRYDGVFLYQLPAAIDQDTWLPENGSTPYLFAGFQSPAIRMPADPRANGDRDACFDTIYSRVSPWQNMYNLDVGGYLGAAIAADSVQMKRIYFGKDDIEYMYDPWISSEPGFGSETGAEISFDGIATGLSVPASLDLVDFGTTWSTFLDTSVLALQWSVSSTTVDGQFIAVDILLDNPVTYESEAIECRLSDDGQAIIDTGIDMSAWQLRLRIAREQSFDLQHPKLGLLRVTAMRDLDIHYDPDTDYPGATTL